MIRALLVDAGGVLFNNVTEDSPFFRLLGERYGVSADAVRAAYAASEPDFETGRSTASGALHSILTQLACDVGDTWPQDVEQLYVSCVAPDEAVFAWLRRRPRPSSLRVLLANNEARDWDHAKHEAFRHWDLFDETFPSWKVGHVKPSAEYFGAVLDRYGVEPRDALLVDDNVSCVEAAAARGLQTVLFDGVDSLPALW